MDEPTPDYVKAQLEALAPGQGYDGYGDPRIVDVLDKLIKDDWAEPFWCSSEGRMMVRKVDRGARDHDLQMIDLLMKRHRWAKVERMIGKTTATRMDEA